MSNPPIHNSHLRITRPTNNIPALKNFYITGLGFHTIGSFTNHAGFDGLMLGFETLGYHLEFTHKHGHEVPRAPTEDNLLVLYIPDEGEWRKAIEKMRDAGFETVFSFNPYWEQFGRTYEDPDGYRVVLQNAGWENKVQE